MNAVPSMTATLGHDVFGRSALDKHTVLLERVDLLRLDAARHLAPDRKATLGQFLTPAPVAQLMASMLAGQETAVSILDAGAGVGSLFAACVAELCQRPRPPQRIHVTAYEIDRELAGYLRDTLALCQDACTDAGIALSSEVRQTDFIESAVGMLCGDLFSPSVPLRPNCVILNPPYAKIHSQSPHRRWLRQLGIETSNLYAGFLAIAARLLAPGGELIAITPRSFCNGPYFRPFRQDFLRMMILRRLHIFDSREQAFKDDAVLQENVILHAVKSGVQAGRVTITASMATDDDLISIREVPADRVVYPGDPQSFIHIVPDDLDQRITERMARFPTALGDLDLNVSTGRVVDFRAREFLRRQPGVGTAPLVYPLHFDHGFIRWPEPAARKPNALELTERTRELLTPNEHYVLVKRFSAKEEKRRIVAAVYDAGRVPGRYVGFENHLNYFHHHGNGLNPLLARGLAAFLNSTLVDTYFRQFNGHTQVNATDLRSLRYPAAPQLRALGALIGEAFPAQAALDELIEQELFAMAEEVGNDPIRTKRRVEEAVAILSDLGFPRAQQNERPALTLLALLDLKPEIPWAEAADPLRGITPMMDFFAEHYGKAYKPNTRETVRRQTVHQFLDAGLVVANPDEPARPTNSPRAVYQIEWSALELLRTFGTAGWGANLRAYLASVETLRRRYRQEREMVRIPVRIAPDKTIILSPGGQNVLVEQIITEFAPRFIPEGRLLYVGDTDEKFAYFDEAALSALGVTIEAHGKMPDLIIHHVAKDWLVLIEAVTSHGPINPKRREELSRLFREARAGLVFVTAFLTRRAMVEYLNEISWETEVWVADAPAHLIHFNGERFLEPYGVGPEPTV